MRGKKKLLMLVAVVMLIGSAASVQAGEARSVVEQISDECRSPLCYDSKNLENYHRYLVRELTGAYSIYIEPTGVCCR